jgi:dipeptidyl-peptidase-4
MGLLCFVAILSARAQRVYTAADYAKAERWMGYNERALVNHDLGGFAYLADGRIFYRDVNAHSTLYWLADPKLKTKTPAFNAEKLAAALRRATGLDYQANQLMAAKFKPDAAPQGLAGFAVTARGARFHCNAEGTLCAELKPVATKPEITVPLDVSPDGNSAVFIRDWNLWLVDLHTGAQRALTSDGVADFGYATDNAGWSHSDAAIVRWSADSKKIATFQQDQRRDGMMYTLSVTDRHPVLESWRYPLLGDQDVTMISRVVIDVPTGKMTRLQMPPDQHRGTICDNLTCSPGSGFEDVEFAPDDRTLAFVSTSRDHKDEWFRVADTTTGDVRTVFHDHAATYYESGVEHVNWKYLPASNEFLWYSQRSDWGQMYLYDLTTGKLKNQITHGEGCVTQVLRVDAKARTIYFLATGNEDGNVTKNGDPYFARFYSARFDGSDQRLLTPENENHEVVAAEDEATAGGPVSGTPGTTYIDTYSTAQQPPTTVVRAADGSVLMTLGTMDIQPLLAAGWRPPQSITVKARDGKTDLYGYLWLPTWFTASSAGANTKLPVVDYVYPGPFTGSCPSRSFHVAVNDHQAQADLGFAVVCIDGLGTPLRSKSFQDAFADSPAVIGEATIPDQVAGLRELAAQHAFLDLARVGVWGHSGGGNATASAMFHFPELFKVGWAESGNHDNREYEDDWDEKYAGLEVLGADGKDNYDAQANENYAANLQGRLMLVHGSVDDNVPLNNTLLVVEALMKANKTFDMLIVPNAHHSYGEMRPYIMRRRWDYFVQYLAGGVPPRNYEMKSSDAESMMRLY